MKIEEKKVVSIHYTLKNNEGEVLDSSEKAGPLAFIFGLGHLIPGLENALESRIKGDKFSVKIDPADAYGPRDDQLIQVIPKTQFEAPGEIQIGMQFEVQTDLGPLIVTVVAVEGDNITIDGNHPLAGVTLNFDVEVDDVRDATQEELDHGHVHGPGGHNH